MSFKDDTYICANRKCKHRYKHTESVMVPEPDSRPEMPCFRGTCPKCGHHKFFLDRKKAQ